MKQMLETHKPNPGRRAPPPAAVMTQAQNLYNGVQEFMHMLQAQKWVTDNIYFGDSICDYLERSTEEGIQKLQLFHQMLDALEEWGGSFGRQFGIYTHADYPPHITKEYLKTVVEALVDVCIPNSALVQGKPMPTTAEEWASLAIASGLDIIAVKDAKGIRTFLKNMGYNTHIMFKNLIITAYEKRKH
jgi:hypothetical protein